MVAQKAAAEERRERERVDIWKRNYIRNENNVRE